jgi:hypothetical protein
MKTFLRLSGAVLMIAACILITFSSGCKKKSNDSSSSGSDDKCTCWDQNWLIGTWEGTTPSSISPFGGTKIRIVISQAHLQVQDTIAGNIRKVWTYSGTFTWDVDGTPWSMGFDPTNYPLAETILWECVEYCAIGKSIGNISIRIADLTQVDPLHTINLDWGPVTSGTGTAPGYIDCYGDVQIDSGGVTNRADYPPTEGSMIRLTKK